MKRNTDHVIEYADFGAIKVNCTKQTNARTHTQKVGGLNFNKKNVRPKNCEN